MTDKTRTLVVVGCETAADIAREQYPEYDVCVAMTTPPKTKRGYERFVMLWAPKDRAGLRWIEDVLWWRGTAPEWVWSADVTPDGSPFKGWESWA